MPPKLRGKGSKREDLDDEVLDAGSPEPATPAAAAPLPQDCSNDALMTDEQKQHANDRAIAMALSEPEMVATAGEFITEVVYIFPRLAKSVYHDSLKLTTTHPDSKRQHSLTLIPPAGVALQDLGFDKDPGLAIASCQVKLGANLECRAAVHGKITNTKDSDPRILKVGNPLHVFLFTLGVDRFLEVTPSACEIQAAVTGGVHFLASRFSQSTAADERHALSALIIPYKSRLEMAGLLIKTEFYVRWRAPFGSLSCDQLLRAAHRYEVLVAAEVTVSLPNMSQNSTALDFLPEATALEAWAVDPAVTSDDLQRVAKFVTRCLLSGTTKYLMSRRLRLAAFVLRHLTDETLRRSVVEKLIQFDLMSAMEQEVGFTWCKREDVAQIFASAKTLSRLLFIRKNLKLGLSGSEVQTMFLRRAGDVLNTSSYILSSKEDFDVAFELFSESDGSDGGYFCSAFLKSIVPLDKSYLSTLASNDMWGIAMKVLKKTSSIAFLENLLLRVRFVGDKIRTEANSKIHVEFLLGLRNAGWVALADLPPNASSAAPQHGAIIRTLDEKMKSLYTENQACLLHRIMLIADPIGSTRQLHPGLAEEEKATLIAAIGSRSSPYSTLIDLKKLLARLLSIASHEGKLTMAFVNAVVKRMLQLVQALPADAGLVDIVTEALPESREIHRSFIHALQHAEAAEFVVVVFASSATCPHWIEQESCRDALSWATGVRETMLSVLRAFEQGHCKVALVDALIMVPSVRGDFIRLANSVASNTAIVAHTTDKIIDTTISFVEKKREAWNLTIGLMCSAIQIPQLNAALEPRLNELSSTFQQQQQKMPLNAWLEPRGIPIELQVAHQFFVEASQSHVFVSCYELVSSGEVASPAAADPLSMWIDRLEAAKKMWGEYVVTAGNSTVADMSRIYAAIISVAVRASEPGAETHTMDALRSRQRTSAEADRFAQALIRSLRDELNIARKLLPANVLFGGDRGRIDDSDVYVQKMVDVLQAIHDGDTICVACECCELYHKALLTGTPEARYRALFVDFNNTTGHDLASARSAVVSQSHHPLRTPRRFFPALRLAFQKDLIKMLNIFPSAQALSAVIVDRSGRAEDRDVEALNGFETIHRAFSATEGVQRSFLQFVQSSLRHPRAFFQYLEEVSWCTDALNANAALLPRVWELLQSEVDENNAAGAALELSQPSTVFTIKARRDANTGELLTELSACTDRNKQHTLADLEDIQFQLTLSGTTVDHGNTDALGNFVKTYQAIKEAHKVCNALVVEGHPRFQESQAVKISMDMSCERIRNDIVEPLQHELSQWIEFKSTAESKYHFLSLLQASDLMRCLAAVEDGNVDRVALAATIQQSVLPLVPLALIVQAVDDIAGDVKLSTSDALTTRLLFINRVIGAAVCHAPTYTSNAHSSPELETFKKLAADEGLLSAISETDTARAVVIQVAPNHAPYCSALSVAISMAVMGRAPFAFEALFCDAAQQNTVNFTRRWSGNASQSLPFASMFSISGADKLKPKEQADLLKAIQSQRSMGGRGALLCIVVADQGHDSLLSAQLRSHCVAASAALVCAAAEVCKSLCQTLPVSVASSESPCSGKTQAVMEMAYSRGLRFASVIVNGDVRKVAESIKQLDRSDDNGRVLLHLSVSHTVEGDQINDQLMSFALLGRLTDYCNTSALRYAQDIIVVEIPSQGKLHASFRRAAPCVDWFRKVEIPAVIRFHTFELDSDERCNTHTVRRRDKQHTEIMCALRILRSYIIASNSGEQRLMHHERLEIEASVDDPHVALELVMQSDPRLRSYDFGTVLRFVRFATTMLYGVHDFGLYRVASKEMEQCERIDGGRQPSTRLHNFRALAFFLTKFSIESAIVFAAAAVPPPSTENQDESERLSQLSLAFSNLRRPFVMFLGETYEFVTSSDESSGNMLQCFDDAYNKRGDPAYRFDEDFHAMVVSDLNSHARDLNLMQSLHMLLCPSHDGRLPLEAFRRVLPVLGLRPNFGIKICEALERVDGILHKKGLTNVTSFREAANVADCLAGGSEELGLVSSVWREKVAANRATVADFQRLGAEWLLSLTASPHSTAPPFVLTTDSLMRLLAVKTRLLCGIPVVFQGETGQGKTHLIQHLSRIAGTHFQVINVHRGVTVGSLLRSILDIEEKMKRQHDPSATSVFAQIGIVVLDEVNSMEDVWVAKTLVCDRLIEGHVVSQNIHFVCIMNPWRRQQTRITPGLDFIDAATTVRTEHLVYDVHRSPESFMSIVWDFGLAHHSSESKEKVQTHLWKDRVRVPFDWQSVSDEDIFAESVLSWELERLTTSNMIKPCLDRLAQLGDVGGNRHFHCLRTLFVALLRAAQQQLRKICGDHAVSLRDITRTVSLIPFLYETQVQYDRCHSLTHVDENNPFRMLQCAVSSSIVMNYLLRLPQSDRQVVESNVLKEWRVYRDWMRQTIDYQFMVAPESLLAEADSIAKKVSESLVLHKGMALNSALKENTLSLFCSVLHPAGNLAQIIAGRPGSTKSASLDALVQTSDRACVDPKGGFFRHWLPIKKFVIQCTRETTAETILRVAKSAAKYQHVRKDRDDAVQCVLVLEEVGIAVGSRHNPLMVLHSLIDRGVTLDDGTTVRIPIVGISNYTLDAAKMNRMRITYRGNPSQHDLEATARTLMSQQQQQHDFQPVRATAPIEDEWFVPFCTTFSELVLSDHAQPTVKWFFGMRDFYAFVAMVKRHLDASLSSEVHVLAAQRNFLSHVLRWALHVNFGGHPDATVTAAVHQAFLAAIFKADDVPLSTSSWTDTSLVSVSGEQATVCLCDMCGRLSWYRQRLLLGSEAQFHLTPILRGGQACNDVNAVTDARSVIAYALHRTPTDVARVYRVRNILLSSRGNAGVELLFRLGLLRREEADIIDSRDPSQLTPQQIMTDLSRVKRCLRTPRTLILVRASHLYEAMFDVLNQHFSEEMRGDELVFYSTLTMDGFTSSVRVSPDNRIIIVEDESKISSLTSPFVNRCVKVHLSFEAALSTPAQRRVFKELKARVEERGASVPRVLIPGFSDETLASLVLNMPIPETPTLTEIGKLLSTALDWLNRTVCPRRLLQACQGLLEKPFGVSSRMVELWDCNSCYTFAEMLQVESDDSAQNDTDAGEGVSTPKAIYDVQQHLMLLTEQRGIDGNLLVGKVTEVFSGFGAVWQPQQVASVNFMQHDMLDAFVHEGNSTPGVNTFGVCVVDLTTLSGPEGASKLDGLIHRISDRCPIGRHIAVVVVLPSTTRLTMDPYRSLSWTLTVRSEWTTLFVDEITTSADLDSNFSAGALWEADLDDVDAQLSALLRNAVTACSTAHQALLMAQSMCEAKDVAHMQSVIRNVLDPERSPETLHFIQITFVTGLMAQLPEFHREWRCLALQQVQAADSVHEQLAAYLVNVARRGIQSILSNLLEGHSHRFLSDPAPQDDVDDTYHELRDIYLWLITQSSLLPTPNFSVSVRGWGVGGTTTKPQLDQPVLRFPFSLRIASLLETTESEALRATQLRDLLSSCRGGHRRDEPQLSRKVVMCYAADLIERRLCVAAESANTLAALSTLQVEQDSEFDGYRAVARVHELLNNGWDGAVEWARDLTQESAKEVATQMQREMEQPHLNSERLTLIAIRASTKGADALCAVPSFHKVIAVRSMFAALPHAPPHDWTLALYEGVSKMALDDIGPDSLNKLLACDDAGELVDVIGSDSSIAAVCLPLMDCVLYGATSPDILVRIVELACQSDSHVPFQVTAMCIKKLINLWLNSTESSPATVFGHRLVVASYELPESQLSLIISRCFFDAAVEEKPNRTTIRYRNLLFDKLQGAAASAGDAAVETFISIALCGVETAMAWLACAHMLADSIRESPLGGPAKVDQVRKHLARALDPAHPRHVPLSRYICRMLHHETVDFGKLNAVLTSEMRKAEAILPPHFFQLTHVVDLTAAPPLPSVLSLIPRFSEARLSLAASLPAAAEHTTRDSVDAAAVALMFEFPDKEAFLMQQCSSDMIRTAATALRYVLKPKKSLLPEVQSLIIAALALLPRVVKPQEAQSRILRKPRADGLAVSQHMTNVMDCLIALLQAATRPGAAQMDQASVDELFQHICGNCLHVVDGHVVERCPNPACRLPFDFFNGCFSVTCRCGTNFCAWCYTIHLDAHTHVKTCSQNPNQGNYFGTEAQFRENNNRRRLTAIRDYLSMQLPNRGALTVGAALGSLLPLLENSGIDLSQLGDFPVNLSVQQTLDHLMFALHACSKTLFGTEESISATVWYTLGSLRDALSGLATVDIGASFDAVVDVFQAIQPPSTTSPAEWVSTIQKAATNDEHCTALIDWLLPRAGTLHAAEIEARSPHMVRLQLDRHYFVRKPFDAISAFWDMVASDSTYDVLKPLHVAANAATPYLTKEYNDHYAALLHAVHSLQTACTEHHISRRTARNTTMAELNDKFHIFTIDQLKGLDKSVAYIWDSIHQVFCKTKDDLVNCGVAPNDHELSHKHLKVSQLLPGNLFSNPDGGFILSLLHGRGDAVAEGEFVWKGLLESHGDVARALTEYGVPAGPHAAERFFRLRASDLLSFDKHHVQDVLLHMYVDVTNPTGSFTKDIAKIRDLIVMNSSLRGKPSLVPLGESAECVVPAYIYPEESTSCVAKFNQRLPFEQLPQQVDDIVKQIRCGDPELLEALSSFLLVLIRELSQRPSLIPLPFLAESGFRSMGTPLLTSQRRAAELLFARVGPRLHTSHLVPILARLGDGHWTDRAFQPLDDGTRIAVTRDIEALCQQQRGSMVETLLESLRVSGLMFLQPNFSFLERYFDGSVIELVLQANNDESLANAFPSLEVPGTLGQFGPISQHVAVEYDRLCTSIASESCNVNPPTPALPAAVPLREALKATEALSSTVTPTVFHEVPETRFVRSHVALWNVDPRLNYGNFQ